MKRMKVLVPCLEGAGGISVLKNLLTVLNKNDYYITVVSLLEGQMRKDFENMGISVQVEEQMMSEEFISDLAEADEVFVNTLQMHPIVRKLNGGTVKVHWWIHEPPAYFRLCKETIDEDFFSHLESNVRVYTAGQLVHDHIWNQYGYDAQVLNFGVEDIAGRIKEGNKEVKERIRFLLPSFYFDYIKGQDLLLKAITELPQEYIEHSEFFFLGYVEEDMQGLYRVIQKLEQALGNVHYLSIMEHDKLLETMNDMDCIIAPSREDATNACIVEGMMLSKICICSDMTGASRYLQDCADALIFPTGNVEELKKRIMLVINSFDELQQIGKNGRRVYEEVFSEEVFEKRVKEIFDV